jgi:predicted transcriptional regulator YdeE/DNA-binding transcriptional MerR regulator
MLRIGEFSKISQVSVKTLRYYNEIGLLKPAQIDRFTGYRYYTLSQLSRLNRILALKDLDFSLEQVLELLKTDLTEESLHRMLQSKSIELRRRVQDESLRLLRVENRLQQLEEAVIAQSPVVLKSAPNYLVATIRYVLPTQEALAEWQQAELTKIRRHLKELGETAAGPDVLIYHQEAFCDVDVDVEVGTILRETRDSIEGDPDGTNIRVHTLHRVNELATAIHLPTASTLANTYASLAHWTQVNGFKPVGPWRELIYAQEKPAPERVIEVQRPVMKAIEFYSPLEVKEMEPKIVTKPGFTIMGIRYFGKNENQEIPAMWGKYNKRIEELGGPPYFTGEACIGLCITPDDASAEDGFEYVAGFTVDKVKDVPEDFVVRQVPEYTYAVFTHKGDLPSLGKTYEYIYETWLPQSGYKLATKMDFEYYDDDFKDFAPDSIFYIYIPIVKE